LVLLLASCDLEDVIPDGQRIISIRHSENPLGFFSQDKEWEEKFQYDEGGNIVKTILESGTSFPSIGIPYNVYEYDNLGRVFRNLYIDVASGHLVAADTIFYVGNSSQIDKISKSWNASKSVFEYVYDNYGNIVRTKNLINGKLIGYVNYYWEQGNVERKEVFRYEPDEFLAYEFFYEYDKKVNYKKNLPLYLSDPLSQTSNNIISEEFNDYYGDWEGLCNPCTTSYKYNASSLPYHVKASWGSTIEITYE
jgi:hypothetical protein